MGVNEWIIIHHPDGIWTAHREGTRLFQPSLCLPQEKIVGANGAGDALAAGMLLGINKLLLTLLPVLFGIGIVGDLPARLD